MSFARCFFLLLLVVVDYTAEQDITGKNPGCLSGHPGIPGNPGHNGVPGRDGRDGAKGEKGDHITVFSRNVRVALMKNGQSVIHTMDNYQNNEDQAAGGTVLHLEAGDKVWLQVPGGQLFNGLYADDDDDTTFSGFLIFAD